MKGNGALIVMTVKIVGIVKNRELTLHLLLRGLQSKGQHDTDTS